MRSNFMLGRFCNTGFLVMIHKIKKGLDLPITGHPKQSIEKGRPVKEVALLGPDYTGMKPSMLVKEGDSVKLGQPVFECKKVPGVIYTAPASGKIKAITRGDKRVFQNLVIEVEGDGMDQVAFTKSKDDVEGLLIESGLWASIRARPFSKTAQPGTKPHSLFITAIDSNPLSAYPEVIVREHAAAFELGVKTLAKLTDGKTFVCVRAGSTINVPSEGNIERHEFTGVHPAGNVGTHIHMLDAVGPKKTVWHIGYQDVIAVGKLFSEGKLFVERVISVAGPMATQPRLIKTRLGACLCDLLEGEVRSGDVRRISGSAFNGRVAGKAPYCYLGRFHNQVTLLEEGKHREFFGWHSPGLDKFSVKSVFLSKLFPNKRFAFDTNTNGSPRAIVPVGSYEKVMPLDILPTQLLRLLLAYDTDGAQELGILELDEEDLALCTFADPGKTDFGSVLRENLNIIEKEG